MNWQIVLGPPFGGDFRKQAHSPSVAAGERTAQTFGSIGFLFCACY